MMNQKKSATTAASTNAPTAGSKKQKKQTAKTEAAPVGPVQPAAKTEAAPVDPVQPATSLPAEEGELYEKITQQGDLIRGLKARKATKEEIGSQVNLLKELKASYKQLTQKDYSPPPQQTTGSPAPAVTTTIPSPAQGSTEASALYNRVTEQGDKIRQLKADKADKATITAEVNVLKELKTSYKSLTGSDYAPPPSGAASKPPTQQQPQQQQPNQPKQKKMAPAAESPCAGDSSVELSTEAGALKQRVIDQGEKIRLMKTSGATKDTLQPEIDSLLKLKAEFKEMTGTDAIPPPAASSKKDKKKKADQSKPAAVATEKPVDQSKDSDKKTTRLGLEAKKEEALSDWYSQVITKSELIEYYDVSGCYILRPWAYSMWEHVQALFNKRIKSIGVQNCYFPMFVSKAALEREKEHIADFAPEVAWVTRSGSTDLAEPIAIRPTSETVMYPTYAKWVQSHRDLPIKLNQWCNVVRWEFKHPQPFLRTREFLWQEGHTAFATREEATQEVYQILDFYKEIYTELLAVPVVPGKKTEKEKFAGADFTTTIEAYIAASGRAIQGATSHHLGQNFSKMFDIAFEDPSKESTEKIFAHQNSWGLTTRTLGVVVMVHGDNQGLVLPPRLADIQVIVIPVGVTAKTSAEEEANIKRVCEAYVKECRDADVRASTDFRENYSPGWKFNHWELKGVPIRMEVGPRDIQKEQFVAVRRDTGEKMTLSRAGAASQLASLLETIHTDMYARASKQLADNLSVVEVWDEFIEKLEQKNLVQIPFCGEIACEENIKKDSAREDAEPGALAMGAKSLCVPFKQPAELRDDLTCIHPGCSNLAKSYTMFGRSY